MINSSKNKKIPFEDNCFTFEDDYNKADHIKIQELVLQLFDISGIKKSFLMMIGNK